ncbi:Zinc finger protein gli2 [Entophlyctis sp. JEL0112]|nr:Zinc finger protein gli2 [Entophlyctis sp. JEL0112]
MHHHAHPSAAACGECTRDSDAARWLRHASAPSLPTPDALPSSSLLAAYAPPLTPACQLLVDPLESVLAALWGPPPAAALTHSVFDSSSWMPPPPLPSSFAGPAFHAGHGCSWPNEASISAPPPRAHSCNQSLLWPLDWSRRDNASNWHHFDVPVPSEQWIHNGEPDCSTTTGGINFLTPPIFGSSCLDDIRESGPEFPRGQKNSDDTKPAKQQCTLNSSDSGAGANNRIRPVFECAFPGCGKIYRAKSSLELHVSTFHEKQRKFACTQCSNKYQTKNRLVVHMRKHTGERPYKCLFSGCSFAAVQKCALTHHQKRKQHGNNI